MTPCLLAFNPDQQALARPLKLLLQPLKLRLRTHPSV
jgi:hypothetical protein